MCPVYFFSPLTPVRFLQRHRILMKTGETKEQRGINSLNALFNHFEGFLGLCFVVSLPSSVSKMLATATDGMGRHLINGVLTASRHDDGLVQHVARERGIPFHSAVQCRVCCRSQGVFAHV